MHSPNTGTQTIQMQTITHPNGALFLQIWYAKSQTVQPHSLHSLQEADTWKPEWISGTISQVRSSDKADDNILSYRLPYCGPALEMMLSAVWCSTGDDTVCGQVQHWRWYCLQSEVQQLAMVLSTVQLGLRCSNTAYFRPFVCSCLLSVCMHAQSKEVFQPPCTKDYGLFIPMQVPLWPVPGKDTGAHASTTPKLEAGMQQ